MHSTMSRSTDTDRGVEFFKHGPVVKRRLDLAGKAGRLGKPQAFHFDASAFGSLGGEPMFLKVRSLVSSDTLTIKTSA